MTAEELRQEILDKTAEYYRLVHKARQDAEFVPGKSRVNYAGRVFDEREMQNLVDSSLEFWLTYGRWSKMKSALVFIAIRCIHSLNSARRLPRRRIAPNSLQLNGMSPNAGFALHCLDRLRHAVMTICSVAQVWKVMLGTTFFTLSTS